MTEGSPQGAISRKSPEVLVPLVGLLFSAVYLVYSVPSVPSDVSTILAVFAVIFFVSAYLVLRRSRIGFVLGIVMSAIFLLNFASDIGQFYSNPSESGQFVAAATVVPALVATLVYSVLGARMAWVKGRVAKPRRMIPYSTTFVFLTIGFVVGALVIGGFAGVTETRLLGNAGKAADIMIVNGAASQGNPAGYFSPANYMVKVGQTVAWSNVDGFVHTVTSASVPSGAGSFDSGNIPTGGEFSWTFTQPGTYTYYCTLHPWMKGTIVVSG